MGNGGTDFPILFVVGLVDGYELELQVEERGGRGVGERKIGTWIPR